MAWTYVTQLSELLAASAAKGWCILTDHCRPGLWAWVAIANLQSQVPGKTLSCLISWQRHRMHCFCSPPSFPWFPSSINPSSLLTDRLSSFYDQKLWWGCRWKCVLGQLGRGCFVATQRPPRCAFQLYQCRPYYKWYASWSRSSTHKMATTSIFIYFYLICSPHIVQNRAVVVYVQVYLTLYHTFYTYWLVLSVLPHCNVVRCTNFLNVLLT